MSEYRCSQCGEMYSFGEYRALDEESRVTDDPTDGYGIEKVCECGARFHSDKWQLVTETSHDGREFKISTVALTIPHGPNHNQWYETCIFHDSGSSVVDRYGSQDDAEEGHERYKTVLRNGDYQFESTGERLVVE